MWIIWLHLPNTIKRIWNMNLTGYKRKHKSMANIINYANRKITELQHLKNTKMNERQPLLFNDEINALINEQKKKIKRIKKAKNDCADKIKKLKIANIGEDTYNKQQQRKIALKKKGRK